LTIAEIFSNKTWVEKYFGEINGEAIPKMEKTRTINRNKKLYYEDNFAKLPQLTLTGLRFTNTIQTVMR
jgi:zinc protease